MDVAPDKDDQFKEPLNSAAAAADIPSEDRSIQPNSVHYAKDNKEQLDLRIKKGESPTNDDSAANFEQQQKVDSDGGAAADGAASDQEQNEVEQKKAMAQ